MSRKRQRGKQGAVAEAKLAGALAAYQSGRVDEARQLCQEILAHDEQHAEALNLLGLAELATGNLDDAERYVAQAILAAPRDPRFHCNLGNVLHQKRRFGEAADAYRRALRIDPQQIDALVNLGNLLVDQKQPEQALQHYQEALRVAPNMAQAHYGQGLALQAQKKHRPAAAAYKRATELRPDWGQAHNNLGRMQWQLAQTEEAIESLHRAAELMPQNALVHRNLGETLFFLAKWDDSRRHFQRAVELDPSQDLAREMAARLANGAPTDLPEDYLRKTFDNYADWFETHLTTTLRYRAPEALRHAVDVVGGALPKPWKVVDLGCGTGLCGAQFAPLARELIGSDLSPKMVEKTRERGIYHQVRTENLHDTLASFADDVDLIVAADVLIYLCDLDDLVAGAAAALRPGGLFAFSTEREDGAGDWSMQSGRYRHSNRLIRSLAERCDLNVALSEPTVIRYEGGQPVAGQVYVLVKGPVPPRAAKWIPLREAAPVADDEKRAVSDLLDTALAAHRQDHLDEAETAYRQILELEPRHAQARHLLGALLDQRGDHAGGISLILSSLEIDPENPSALNSLGNALAAAGQLADAVDAYRKAIRLAPRHAHLHCRLGEVLLKLGRRDEAEDCVEQARAISPESTADFAHLVEEITRDQEE